VKVRVEMLERTTLVIPEGRLDFSAAAHFQQHVEQALAGAGAAPAALIIDCTALEYVSSAGLRIFLLAARASQRAGIAFALSTLQPAVREVFELSGFSRMMPVHADRDAALAQLPPGPVYKERHAAAPNDAAELPALTRFLQEFWSAAQLPAPAVLPFELALEEAFMNIVMHGAPPGTARVEVSLVLAGPRLTLTIEDEGPQFDPLSLPAPDITAPLEERRVGGQGVHLIRQMMDEVSYQRVGARNQLKMSRQIDR
jgi:serine/threonine-protein kinase RsbW